MFPIEIPPLRERVEDIPALVGTFIDEFSRAFGKPIDSIAQGVACASCSATRGPGNVRELRNVIERAVIVATGRTLVVSAPHRANNVPPRAAHDARGAARSSTSAPSLESTNWRIRGRVARPSASASSRPRSKAGWPSWDSFASMRPSGLGHECVIANSILPRWRTADSQMTDPACSESPADSTV